MMGLWLVPPLYSIEINGTEFVRRAKGYARNVGLEFRFDRSEGKGSHGRLYLGGKTTFVKWTEIGKGLLAAMLKELGVRKEEF